MFSKRMGLVLTYNNKNTSPLTTSTSTPRPATTPTYTRMNRLMNTTTNTNINGNTMSSIIHQPPGTCSSCGN